MKRKKILITGADGVFAKYVLNQFTKSNYEVVALSKKQLNITKKDKVIESIISLNPTIIIHLAALTNVDECEKNPLKAKRINELGTQNIALASTKSILIYISTSAVFSGEKQGYKESDMPKPISVYGKTKLAGEEIIKNTLSHYYIVRAGWLIGGGKNEKKFISYIYDDIKNGKTISVVNDKFGTVTYASELAEFLEGLIAKKHPYGIYHFGSKGICSRLDMALHVSKILKKNVLINAISSDRFKKVFFAPRPKFEVLKSVKIKFPNTWKKSLSNYINHEFN